MLSLILNKAKEHNIPGFFLHPLLEMHSEYERFSKYRGYTWRSLFRSGSILLGIIGGGLLTYYYAPYYAIAAKIAAAIPIVNSIPIAKSVLTPLFGTWMISYATAVVSKQLSRIVCKCAYRDADYYLTEQDLVDISDKIITHGVERCLQEKGYLGSDFQDNDMNIQHAELKTLLKDIFNHCVQQVREGDFLPGSRKEDLELVLHKLKEGDIETFLDQQERMQHDRQLFDRKKSRVDVHARRLSMSVEKSEQATPGGFDGNAVLPSPAAQSCPAAGSSGSSQSFGIGVEGADVAPINDEHTGGGLVLLQFMERKRHRRGPSSPDNKKQVYNVDTPAAPSAKSTMPDGSIVRIQGAIEIEGERRAKKLFNKRSGGSSSDVGSSAGSPPAPRTQSAGVRSAASGGSDEAQQQPRLAS